MGPSPKEADMTTEVEKNKRNVIAFYEAFSSADVDRFDALLLPSFENHPADPGRSNDVAGFKAGVADFHAAFEGFEIRRDALICEGDLVVCRITMTGRHVAAIDDWQPSGQKVTFHGMDMHRLEDDRIAETWHFERFGT